MARKTTVKETVKVERFELKWPPELEAIKPMLSMAISKTRSAEVFEIPYAQSIKYRVRCIITKTGMIPVDINNEHWAFRGHDYDDLTQVKHAIEEMARVLSKREATRKVKTELVDNDDE